MQLYYVIMDMKNLLTNIRALLRRYKIASALNIVGLVVTGLLMTADIDRQGGRELLRECIARGPEYFIETWEKSEKKLQ